MHNILTEIADKCKSDQVYITALIILVGIGSFGLGRLSKIEDSRQKVSIEAPLNIASALAAEGNLPAENGQDIGIGVEQNGEVVASKSGTKYHYPWCSGAKSIADKNKIWFNSIAEARAAGYTPASNCKGLK